MPDEEGGGLPPPDPLGFRGPRFGIIGPGFGVVAGSLTASALLETVAEFVATPVLGITATSQLDAIAELFATGVVGVSSTATLEGIAELTGQSVLGFVSTAQLDAISELFATLQQEGLSASALFEAIAEINASYVALCPCPEYGHDQTLQVSVSNIETLSDANKKDATPIPGMWLRKGCE